MLLAWRKDRQEVGKGLPIVLKCGSNGMPEDGNHHVATLPAAAPGAYHVTVYTGNRAGSGTTANVYMIFGGDKGEWAFKLIISHLVNVFFIMRRFHGIVVNAF